MWKFEQRIKSCTQFYPSLEQKNSSNKILIVTSEKMNKLFSTKQTNKNFQISTEFLMGELFS
jgi:hypothetical protein